MRVSEYFGLGTSQPYLDFVDVRLDTDLAVFIDPTALRAIHSTWATECVSLLQHFFGTVLRYIRENRNDAAISLLAALNERNEFHLGFSEGRSSGRGLGNQSARAVWSALTNSRAAHTGALQDLEDTCLLIDGIGPDRVSDAVCNIIRGPLIRYTQNACAYYGIPLSPDVDSGPVWNQITERWEHNFISLPVTEFGKLLLVPKFIVRHSLAYDASHYYRHYLLPQMQQQELNNNSALVEVLKDNRRRVTKVKLMETYGSDKLAITEQTIRHPDVLGRYREDQLQKISKPLSHYDLASLENSELPNLGEIHASLNLLTPGAQHADVYEKRIEQLFTALFYPSLVNPVKQHRIHNGRKRIDITYVNIARSGFFSWLAQHYAAPHIFVECKNYNEDPGNPELDQLSGRFSPSRGRVGMLLCRNISNKALLMQRCRDTANDDRGFILPLDDVDLVELIEERGRFPHIHDYSLLRRLFDQLIM